MSNLGSLLRGLRRKKRLTQRQLAAASGLSRGYVALIETGSRTPEQSVVEGLADALQLDAADRAALIGARSSPVAQTPVRVTKRLEAPDWIRNLESSLDDGQSESAVLGIEAAASVPESPSEPTVIGPFQISDGSFGVTLWHQPVEGRSFVLVEDRREEKVDREIRVNLKFREGAETLSGRISGGSLLLLLDHPVTLPVVVSVEDATIERSR